MADILVFAETRKSALRGVAREFTSAGSRIAGELGAGVHAVVIGGPGVGGAAAGLAEHGADRIFVAEDAGLLQYSPTRTCPSYFLSCDWMGILVVRLNW